MDISARKIGSPAAVFAVRLVNKIQIGDEKAEADFIEAYSSDLMSVLLAKTHDPDIASDCCQKTFLITLNKIRAGGIRKPQSIRAFLRRTASNVAITHHRTENRYKNLGHRVCQLPYQAENPATLEIDAKIIRCLLQKILNQLSIPRDREILQRFYLYEENKSSICLDFGIKSAHFDRVLYRAKQRVRLMLENQKNVRELLYDCLGEVKPKSNKPSKAGSRS